jgi:tetratricopeptide (TPR) repeat protein
MRLLEEIRSLMGNYHVKSGIYHYYRSEFKQAVDFFRKALRDEPNLTEADRRTARYYLTQTFIDSAERLEAKSELDAAARDYARAAEVSPDYPDIRFRLGRVLEDLGRTDEAIEEYRRAIACSEDYLAARTALAFCLLRAGRDEDAAIAFDQALELKIRKVRGPYEKGLRRLREGMTAEAEEFFRETFLASPDRFAEQYRAALDSLKGGDYEKALERLDQAIVLSPKFADLHNSRGITLCELGRLDEGIAAFRRSATLNPDYLVPKLNLAFAQLRAGQFKDAEAQLESVLAQDPSQGAAAAKLEELRTGRATEARRSVPRGGTR